MNVFLIGMPEVHKTITTAMRALPQISVLSNFQQVKGMVKLNELSRLCIYMDAWNGDDSYNGERGQTIAERMHEINESIPILIWSGRKYKNQEDISPVFIVTGKKEPIKYRNELYLSINNYISKDYHIQDMENNVVEITKLFFEGKLKDKDVPERECLDMKQTAF